MFSGSSCSHTICLAFGYVAKMLRKPAIGNGYNCSTRTTATLALRLVRSAIASHATLPVHNTMRVIFDLSVTVGSSRISSKLPVVNSAIGERLSFMRNGCLGVMTTSGLRTSRRTWRRNMWKYCAAVVG